MCVLCVSSVDSGYIYMSQDGGVVAGKPHRLTIDLVVLSYRGLPS